MGRNELPPTCADCTEFADDPRALEALFVGMTALSSAYGSTRGRAGVCRITDTFHDPDPACPSFMKRGESAGEGR